MAHPALPLALAAAIAALPTPVTPGAPAAPQGTPATRYCLRVDPIIGSRIETVQCRTRDEWADLGLNVDQEWGENGVGVVA